MCIQDRQIGTSYTSNSSLRPHPKNTCDTHDPKVAEFQGNQEPIINSTTQFIPSESTIPERITIPYNWGSNA